MHIKCAVSQKPCHQTQIPITQKLTERSNPRTQCHTSVKSLRKQNSKLPCKRPQIRVSAQGRALPPVSQGPFSPSMATGTLVHPWTADGSSGGQPVLLTEAYMVSLLCVVGTERCVTQVPTSPPYFNVARINSLNRGCALFGRDLNSGWNCEATNHG